MTKYTNVLDYTVLLYSKLSVLVTIVFSSIHTAIAFCYKALHISSWKLSTNVSFLMIFCCC